MPLMGPFMDPRGLKGEYPSLFDMTHITQRHIYELESTGLLVDKERLYGLIDRYQARKDELKGQLVTMAANLGYPDFNPASSEQKQDLLFRVLKLNPVKTTEGRSWADVAGNAGIDDEENEDINAATDKTTLEILLDEHPIVEMLLNFTRLDTACKNQMRYAKPGDDPSTRGGGIEGKIWPDGRLHAHFSQLSDTGRFKHSKPNVACFSKKAEG
jgi:DNA polymerase I-like protein with 3'-5' exonuclease and polymerase domains